MKLPTPGIPESDLRDIADPSESPIRVDAATDAAYQVAMIRVHQFLKKLPSLEAAAKSWVDTDQAAAYRRVYVRAGKQNTIDTRET